MNDNYRTTFGIKLFKTKESLDKAILYAGGVPDLVCSIERLETMTAFEFLCILATNDIFFEYKKKHD